MSVRATSSHEPSCGWYLTQSGVYSKSEFLYNNGEWAGEACFQVQVLCPHCALLIVPPPVFSRPSWPCRSSWPRAWRLASCPAPSPSQPCAQWRLTRWLCATQWAPPPSSRPPSWALHCFDLLRGHCGPHTHPSSSPPTKDLTHFSFELHPCPFTKPQALLQCDPHNKGHTQTMQPAWLTMERVHKSWRSVGR